MELSKSYLVLCLMSCLVPVMSMGCPYEECLCVNTTIINCKAASLDFMPSLSNETFTSTSWELNLNNNRITNISGRDLPANLTSLDLSYNPIAFVSRDAFDDSSNTLGVIKLSGAKITALPTALLSLTSLTTLWIEDTDISSWEKNILFHLSLSLKELVLNRVGLNLWPKWIGDFFFLQKLELSGIPMSDIPERALDHLSLELEILSVNWANISRIPKALASLESLKTLKLSNNHLQDVDGLPLKSKLETLDLTKNKISDVYQLVYFLYPYESSLTKLLLGFNELRVIPHLDHMLNLTSVSLAGNQITNPTKGSFPPTVTYLDFGHNKMASIPSVVSRLPKLTELKVNSNLISRIQPTDIPIQLLDLTLLYNKITELNDTAFLFNSSLRTLDLSHNPLSVLTPLAFQNVPNLISLSLRYTKLTRVPMALSSLPRLGDLVMDENPLMICTCSESRLADWFQGLANMQVSGTCGNTDISTFFRTLAAQC